ncbi:hypothetical protein ACF0H5_014657 [Mactra antiquata]
MKYNSLVKENTMMDNLSSTKRKFIENWRQNVSVFMENGNICRVTIAELTPEPESVKWPSAEHTKAMQGEISPRTEMASPTLPSVKFSYSHAPDEHRTASRQQTRSKSDKSRNGMVRTSTTLPPSPNGVVVQNGMDIHQAYKRRTSAMRAIENNMASNAETPEVSNNKDLTRRSSRLAREIYEKYNMKSNTHNALPGRNTVNGFDQYSMPWRNKTFLSLPLRFNGTNQQRNDRLTKQKTFYNGANYDVDDSYNDLHDFGDWKDVNNW